MNTLYMINMYMNAACMHSSVETPTFFPNEETSRRNAFKIDFLTESCHLPADLDVRKMCDWCYAGKSD